MKKLLALLITACCALHSTIFIAGQNDLDQATLWITDSAGTLIKTTPLDTSTSNAINCIIAGSEVYICGFNSNGKPSVWITDLFGIAKTPISLSDQQGQAQAMIVSNNTIYVVGASNEESTLWIIDSNTQNFFTKKIGSGYAASNITLYENKLYIIGSVPSSVSASTASLWITDMQGTIENTVYLSNIGTTPTGISSAGQSIYILSHNQQDYDINFYLTQTQLDGTVIKKIPFATKNVDSCNIITKQGSNYLLTNNGLYVQTISNLDTTPYPLLIPKIDRNTSWAYFQLKNSSVYIAGTDSLTRAALFIYDSSGALKKVTKLSDEGSSAFGLSILEPLDAFKKFSPFSFQKGF